MSFSQPCHFRCKMGKNAFLRPKKAKIKKSEENGPNLIFNFTWKYVPELFLWAPGAEKMTLSFNFACFWSSNTSSHNLGVMWRWNQKRKSFGIYHYREALKKNVNFCTIWVKMGWVPIFSHFSPIFPEWKNQLLLCYILTIYSNMDRKYFLFMYSTEAEPKKSNHRTTGHETQTWISDGDDHDGKIVYNRVAIVLRPRHMILKSCVTLIS